jgi:CheY-like chemotaxis protein
MSHSVATIAESIAAGVGEPKVDFGNPDRRTAPVEYDAPAGGIVKRPNAMRILVIGHDASHGQSVREALANARDGPFIVEGAPRLADGLDRLRRNGVVAVLLDLTLPDGEGAAAFEQIRLAAPHVPILVIVPPDDHDVALQAIKREAQDYLQPDRLDNYTLPRALKRIIAGAALCAAAFDGAKAGRYCGVADEMSLVKRCSGSFSRTLPDGTANPLFCPDSPKREHHWHYVFHVNGRRYRASTETHLKNLAEQIEAREHARILEGRHGIRRIPDITFAQFAKVYLRDHAALHKKSADRDQEILKSLERFFGSILLRDLTAHRIEQWKRERLAGRWRGHLQKGKTKPIQPATVNRESDTLKSMLSKAVEWGKPIADGHNGHTVMAVVGQSSGRMLERYTHPTEEHKVGALESIGPILNATNTPQRPAPAPVRTKREAETPRRRTL